MIQLILISCAILALATAIQSVVGFGMALSAIPLLVMAGIPPLSVIFIVLSISFLSALMGATGLKGEFDLKMSLRAAALRMVGVVPGYALALHTLKTSPDALKAVMGVAIGLGVIAQLKKTSVSGSQYSGSAAGKEPSAKLAPYAFLSSGVLMGWIGMGGPPLIFWLLTGRQDPKRSRGFLYGLYVLTIPFQLVLMAYHDPSTVSLALPILAVATPVCLVVTSMALKVGDRLGVQRLQSLSLLLLSVLALKALGDWLITVV